MDETITGEIKRIQDELRAYKSAQARLVKDMPTFSATVSLPSASARKKVFVWARGSNASQLFSQLEFHWHDQPDKLHYPCLPGRQRRLVHQLWTWAELAINGY